MFRIIQQMFGKKDLLQEALEHAIKMLQIDKQMFDASVTSLRTRDTAEVEIDIYKTDKEINQLEQEVRRKVMTHLAVSGTSGLGLSLTLVSIISDIERIGDYTKNIYELATVHPTRLKAGKWEDDLQHMESVVSQRLGDLMAAFKESDKDLGRSIIEELVGIKDKCDDYIMKLIKGVDESFQATQAVPLVLYLRYLKRVGGHVQNVASSIVNPFHKIKYRDKHRKLVEDDRSGKADA